MIQDTQAGPPLAQEAEYTLPSVFALRDGPMPSSGHWCIPGTPYTLWWHGENKGMDYYYEGVLMGVGNTHHAVMDGLQTPGQFRYVGASCPTSLARALASYLVRLHTRVERAGGWEFVEASYRLGGIEAVKPLLGGVGCLGR